MYKIIVVIEEQESIQIFSSLAELNLFMELAKSWIGVQVYTVLV